MKLFKPVIRRPTTRRKSNPQPWGIWRPRVDTMTSDISEGPRYIGRDPDGGDRGGGTDGRITR